MEELLELTDCRDVKIVRRCNKAIQYALRIAKASGKSKVLIQDQGGWITYEQYPPKMKMELVRIKTDFGLIDKDDLSKQADSDSVLLINSMPGYHALQDIEIIVGICEEAGCLVINDVSGSIGTDVAKYGDIIVCSFGCDKPIAYGSGGFIAVKDKRFFDYVEVEEIPIDSGMERQIRSLHKRLETIQEIRKEAIADLKDFNIIHPDSHGINIIILFKDFKEKEKIINFCETNKFEFTLCPRYIRVNADAVSIEIKRLFKGDI